MDQWKLFIYTKFPIIVSFGKFLHGNTIINYIFYKTVDNYSGNVHLRGV